MFDPDLLPILVQMPNTGYLSDDVITVYSKTGVFLELFSKARRMLLALGRILDPHSWPDPDPLFATDPVKTDRTRQYGTPARTWYLPAVLIFFYLQISALPCDHLWLSRLCGFNRSGPQRDRGGQRCQGTNSLRMRIPVCISIQRQNCQIIP
jgi:hypothetical protein